MGAYVLSTVPKIRGVLCRGRGNIALTPDYSLLTIAQIDRLFRSTTRLAMPNIL